MENNTIKFSTNWNHKLDCNYFTTIRLYGKKYSIGKTFEVQLKDNHFCNAVVQDMYVTKLEQLNDFNCYLDTGYSKLETENIFRKMYPTVDFATTNLIIILLKKI